MKKGVGLFLLLICFYIQVMEVSADVIFEPQDIFYKHHANECEYVNHFFIVNGMKEKQNFIKVLCLVK